MCDSYRLVEFNYKCKLLWVRSLHLADTVTCDSVRGGGGDIRPVFATIAFPCIDKPLHLYARFEISTYATTTQLSSPWCVDIFIRLRAPPLSSKTNSSGSVVVPPFCKNSSPCDWEASSVPPVLHRIEPNLLPLQRLYRIVSAPSRSLRFLHCIALEIHHQPHDNFSNIFAL